MLDVGRRGYEVYREEATEGAHYTRKPADMRVRDGEREWPRQHCQVHPGVRRVAAGFLPTRQQKQDLRSLASEEQGGGRQQLAEGARSNDDRNRIVGPQHVQTILFNRLARE